jgi:CRISPR-associated protein Csx1
MTSVLIAPWGKPWRGDGGWNWEEVDYTMAGSTLRGRTTLPLLRQRVNPSKVLLIVLDTAIDEGGYQSYSDMEKQVAHKFSRFLIDELKVVMKPEPEFAIAPGVGKFKISSGTAIFKGRMSDFYAYTFFKLANFLNVQDNKLDVHLDLTHGINFMPTLAYRACRDALGILALAKDNVTLRVYNSEPFNRDATRQAEIHIVEDRRIQPSIASDALDTDKGSQLLRPAPVSDADIGRDQAAEYNSFLSSIINGLPLALYTFYPNSSEIFAQLDRALDAWRSEIGVSSADDGIVVDRKTLFTQHFVTITRIGIASRALNMSRKSEASMDELVRTLPIYSRWTKVHEMVSDELIKISDQVRYQRKRNSRELEDWTRLFSSGQDLRRPEHFMRIFFAHSGLASPLTHLKFEKGTIKMRYDRDQLDFVKRLCQGGLVHGPELIG